MKYKNTYSAAILCSLSLAALAAGPVQAADLNSTFSVDANIELDTDAIDHGPGSTEYTQGGRVETNLRGEIRSERYFVRGKGTLILAKDSDALTDDMWIQFGEERWDMQFGRFEAIDLFPLGKDTLIVHAGDGEPQIYQANLVRGRAGTDGGQIALHLNGDGGFGFELATLFGDDQDNGDGVEGTNENAVTGVRPVLTYNNDGGISARLGYEYQDVELIDGSEIKQDGIGLGASLGLGDALINLNAAWLDNQTNDFEVHTYGANLIYGPFGLGLIYSETDNNTGADPEVATAYAAYTMPLLDIDSASVTFALSGSTADNVTNDDSAFGSRVRFNYTF